jgi:hypothetical protein
MTFERTGAPYAIDLFERSDGSILARRTLGLLTALAIAIASVTLLIGSGVPPASAARLTPGSLASAPVPSLCGFPAGHLVDGALPAARASGGAVELVENKSTFGRLRADGRRYGVAVITCSASGVGGTQALVVYSPKREIVSALYLGDVTRGIREGVRKMWIKKRVLHVQVVGINAGDDVLCCGSRSAKLTLRLGAERDRLRVTSKRIFDERATVRRLLRAVERNQRKRALSVATRPVVRELRAVRDRGRSRYRLEDCFGRTAEYGWQIEGKETRSCMVSVTTSTYPFPYQLWLTPRGWKSWRTTRIAYVGG